MTIKKTSLTIFLVILGVWLMAYSWQARRVTMRSFENTMEAADRLKAFPVAQFKIGYQLWFQNRLDVALNLFRRAVSKNFCHLDAWLKMGEIEATRGNRRKAMDILKFTDQVAPNVYSWKWRQTLLAHNLGLEQIFLRNINYLIPFPKSRQNALFMLDQAYGEDSAQILETLAHDNYISYLYWLLGGRRVDDAQTVWQALDDHEKEQPALLSRYVHFLLHNKRVADAKAVWRQAGHFGIINPKFEEAMINQGFGWRFFNPKTEASMIKRKYLLQSEREYVLQVTFSGQQNLGFSHFFQILPADPGKKYRIGWDWKSRQLTTDQRPFIEIYGFECKGLYVRGSMLPGSTDWHEAAIEFEVPEDCEAVGIRLRRLPSKRFDSKISGMLWMDNFSMRDL